MEHAAVHALPKHTQLHLSTAWLVILLLLSALHARIILLTALPASPTNIWLNLYKWGSISLVLVPALFHTAREIRLPWFAGRIV